MQLGAYSQPHISMEFWEHMQKHFHSPYILTAWYLTKYELLDQR